MNQNDKANLVKNSLLQAENAQLSGWVDTGVQAGEMANSI